MGRAKKHKRLKAIDPCSKNCQWGVDKPDPTGRRNLPIKHNEDTHVSAKVRALMRAKQQVRKRLLQILLLTFRKRAEKTKTY
jgi:hypothetical protein